MASTLQVLLLALLSSRAAGDGETVTYCGYLLDVYCYKINLGGSRALDGSNLITGPWGHKVYCLRDVAPCIRDGYYLSYNRGTAQNPDYHPWFYLDAEGNTNALAEIGRTNKRDAFTVCATGINDGDGTLRSASVTECTGQNCDGRCEGNCMMTEIATTITESTTTMTESTTSTTRRCEGNCTITESATTMTESETMMMESTTSMTRRCEGNCTITEGTTSASLAASHRPFVASIATLLLALLGR